MGLAGLGGGVGRRGLLQRVGGFLGRLSVGLQRLRLNGGRFLGAAGGLLPRLFGSLRGCLIGLIGIGLAHFRLALVAIRLTLILGLTRIELTLIGTGMILIVEIALLRGLGMRLIGVGLSGLLQTP